MRILLSSLSHTMFSFAVHTAFNALTGDFKMIFAAKPLVDEGAEKPDRTRNLCTTHGLDIFGYCSS